MYISDETLEKFIKEDIPYLDLTSCILNIAEQNGKMRFVCREEAVVCGTEEVLRIFDKLGVAAVGALRSGTKVMPGTVLVEGEGDSEKLHMAWKVSLNILEYASGIATRTSRLLELARAANPKVQVVTTRKGCPGTKELSIKAVVSGGGFPHRLGLSESVLIFPHHSVFLGGMDRMLENMDEIKAKACENKVIVEVETVEEAVKACKAGADGVQFDKIECGKLHDAVKLLKDIKANMLVLAAGGINIGNVEAYAGTGVDAIVTSSVYYGKPVDIGTVMVMGGCE